MTKGATLLKTLEERKANALISFTNGQLMSLLVHANSRKNILKSKNKSDYRQRVRGLTTVQLPVNTYALAVATTQAPKLAIPPASMDLNLDDFLRLSFGSADSFDYVVP